MAPEFLQLAHKYDPKKHRINGWLVSNKLDGVRCFWDGGISIGLKAEDVPWANIDKHSRYVNQIFCTGLWTRYGQPIQAPRSFTAQLLEIAKDVCLDGELWMGIGKFQETVSTVKRLEPDERWNLIQYQIFDIPSHRSVFGSRIIKNTNFKKDMSPCLPWIMIKGGVLLEMSSFLGALHRLKNIIPANDNNIKLHTQVKLDIHTGPALDELNSMMATALSAGHEGLILRSPGHIWTPERTHNILKVKPENDAEAIVVGYTWGRATLLGSKLLGKMGALIVRLDSGLEFELSGFTDEERIMAMKNNPIIGLIAAQNEGHRVPGTEVTSEYHNPKFPIGTRISFKYRELTDSGIPKEARYWRKFG